jgi:DNA-binding NtrC family response regulator
MGSVVLISHRFAEEHTPLDAARVERRQQLCLMIVGDGFVGTHPLPEGGDVILGRANDADVRIDVAKISRHHAVLHVDTTVRIEDLGSSNGTFVRGDRIAPSLPVTVRPGDIVELGSTMIIIHQGFESVRPRRIWTHGYFETRLEEECARAERSHGHFALVRMRPANRHAVAAMHELLLRELRPGDIIASYGPDDYEVLVVDARPDEARAVLDRLGARLGERGAEVSTGVAFYPSDGRIPEALMAKACCEIDDPEGNKDDTVDGEIVVESQTMLRLHKLVGRIAASSINVLVLGETGVGKEIIAERIHALSPRVGGPLLRLNCAALSETLLESELFGHVRGAFTGATADKAGLLETADGGTVFLDEIGDMPLSVQAKLLRVIEDRCVRRVGSLQPHRINIRIVAATHRNLEADIERGSFREDLYFRLNGMTIIVPPLRERREEIMPLARKFAAKAQRKFRGTSMSQIRLSAPVQELLRSYSWPGNIRELRNVMERAALLCGPADLVTPDHLPSDKMRAHFAQPPRKGTDPGSVDDEWRPATPKTTRVEKIDLRQDMKAHERQLVVQALDETGGNQTRAAKLLGISRRTLISRIEEFGLPRPRKRKR